MGTAKPTLIGWLTRDGVILGTLAFVLLLLHQWETSAPSLATTISGNVTGFVAAYATCYIMHEWGHLAGARITGSHMPLGHYKGILIGYFDVNQHSRQQFVAMSWGGVAFYLLVAATAVVAYLIMPGAAVIAGFTIGAIAFIAQSLAVDLPIIIKVQKGAPIATTASSGAAPDVILRRTWQTWVPLSIALLIWNQVLS